MRREGGRRPKGGAGGNRAKKLTASCGIWLLAWLRLLVASMLMMVRWKKPNVGRATREVGCSIYTSMTPSKVRIRESLTPHITRTGFHIVSLMCTSQQNRIRISKDSIIRYFDGYSARNSANYAKSCSFAYLRIWEHSLVDSIYILFDALQVFPCKLCHRVKVTGNSVHCSRNSELVFLVSHKLFARTLRAIHQPVCFDFFPYKYERVYVNSQSGAVKSFDKLN
jgi:hypothetical protein